VIAHRNRRRLRRKKESLTLSVHSWETAKHRLNKKKNEDKGHPIISSERSVSGKLSLQNILSL